MSEIEINNLKPFFARYLEGQIPEEEQKTVTGGKISFALTKKYPSDVEAVTLKYPSDADEVVTLKYPSDGDDHISW